MHYSRIVTKKECLHQVIITELSGKKIEGYLWLSGKDSPEIFDGEKGPAFEFDPGAIEPHFIWELNGYEQGGLSFSVKFLGGCWMVTSIDWKKNFPEGYHSEEYTFLTKKLGGRKLKFLRCYLPLVDQCCENMESLQPAWTAFKGFCCDNKTTGEPI